MSHQEDPISKAFSLQVVSRQLMGTLEQNVFPISSERADPFYLDPNDLKLDSGEELMLEFNLPQEQVVQEPTEVLQLNTKEQLERWVKEVEVADFGLLWPDGYPDELRHLTQVEANAVLLVRQGLHKPCLVSNRWPDHFMEDLQQLPNQEEASAVWNLRSAYDYLAHLERMAARTSEEIAFEEECRREAGTFASYFRDGEDIDGQDWSDALSGSYYQD